MAIHDRTASPPPGGSPEESDQNVLRERDALDKTLIAVWNQGETMMLAWSREQSEISVLAVPHYSILEPQRETHGGEAAGTYRDFINRILGGPKQVSADSLRWMRRHLGSQARIIRFPLSPDTSLSAEHISELVTRYGVTHVNERAVILLDIVGFSLQSPIAQVAMLNSLSYSINSASRQLFSRSIKLDFARTTTGDGFYIWNRSLGLQANIALYKLLMLILADNAVARRKAVHFPVPMLRAAFHIGEHYEFYQVEGLNPSSFNYIVGHVTIELARMLAGALPGQIIVGDFHLTRSDLHSDSTEVKAPKFIEQSEAMLDRLVGLEVAGDRVRNIRCYLTGEGSPSTGFHVNRHLIRDKHGQTRWVYNAKINIHLQNGDPIFLGIQNRGLPGPTQAAESHAAPPSI